MLRRPALRQLQPLRLRGFRLLFLSTLVSSFGTLVAAVALAVDVKDRTNAGVWVGAVLVMDFLPTVLVGLTLGPLLDRLERRRLMVAADLVRAAVFCALPFAGSPAEIVVLAGLAGLASGFFRPAVYAGLPNLVPEETLPHANGLLQTIENAAWAAGPIVGGILTAAAGPHVAYWVNAGSFLVSATLVVRIPARLLQSETALTRGHWRDLADGLRAVVASRPLLAVLVGWGIAGLGIGGVGVAEVFVAKNTFHAGDFGYGLLFGAIGGGMVVGSLGAGGAIERVGVARAYSGALAIMAVGFVAAAASPDVWVAAVCCAVGGIGDGIAVVGNAVLVQRGARDELRGRAVTLLMSGTITVQAAGSVLAGALMPPDGGRWVWLGCGVAFAAGGLAAFLLARDAAPKHAAVAQEWQ